MSTQHSDEPTTTTHLTMEAIEQELARQNDELARAARQLAAMGTAQLSVPRTMLEALDEACLVRTSTLTGSAIRG